MLIKNKYFLVPREFVLFSFHKGLKKKKIGQASIGGDMIIPLSLRLCRIESETRQNQIQLSLRISQI